MKFASAASTQQNNNSKNPPGGRVNYNVKDVVELHLSRVTHRARDDVFKKNPGVQVCNAMWTVSNTPNKMSTATTEVSRIERWPG